MKDIKEKNDTDLRTLLGEKQEEVRLSRFGIGAKNRDVRAVRKTRRDIARVLTEMNLRKLQA